MKEFFKEELNITTKTIKNLQSEDTLTFNLIADSHIFSYTEPDPCGQPINCFENVKELNKIADIDCLFHNGDLMWFMKDYWNEENTTKFLRESKKRLTKCNKNAFFVPGNHDGNNAQPPSEEQYFNIFIKDNIEKLCNFKENKPYYSVDFKEKNVRVICLMACFQENGKNYYGWYDEQLKWLSDELNSVPDGYKIILLSHINPIDGDKRTENANKLIDLLNAHHKKISLMITAHTHYDRIVKQNVLHFPIIERACNRLHEINKGDGWGEKEGGFSPGRKVGTPSEDLWDTVIFNSKENTVDFVRFGAGEDLHINL